MADNTIIQQGTFLSDGQQELIRLRSDIDWMRVYNYTQVNNPADGKGVEYFWFRGMSANDGFVWMRTNAATAIDMRTANDLAVPGFTLFNSSVPVLSDLRATTGISAGPQPVVDTADTSDLQEGDIVRLYAPGGALQLGGMDFQVETVNAGDFNLAFMRTIVAAPLQAGGYRKLQFGSYFYPRHRFITRISQAVQALVTMSVAHEFTVGQEVRFIVPKVRNSTAWGMVELNEMQGAIVAIDEADADGFTNTIRVNIDTRAMTPFEFPVSANVPLSPALVVPVGQDTGVTLANGAYILADSTFDDSAIGMLLGYDATGDSLSPAGELAEVMYWEAGKSFSVDNKAKFIV